MKSLIGTIRRPDVIFRANGNFDLTARVVRILGLQRGDAVDILTDGDEYYLYVARRKADTHCVRFSAQVAPSSRKNTTHFRGSSLPLCRAILKAAHTTTRAALPCGEPFTDRHGRTLLPVIVRLNLSSL